jgi:SAM-dependent methyltransferase
VDYYKYRSSELEKARTADLLRILPKGRATVLDIGTRDGHFSKLLVQHFSSVTALDLEKPSFQHPGVVTVAGDVTMLEFPENAFDCVFCTEVLEHIPNVENACREIVRVARYEIVVGVPFKQDIRMGRTTCRTCRKVSPQWGHVHSFDEKLLLQLFPGLRVISKSFVGTNREATNGLAVALMDLAGNPWGTYDEESHCPHCGARLRPPSTERPLRSRVCSALAHKINQVQSLVTSTHPNWIHLVLAKQQ